MTKTEVGRKLAKYSNKNKTKIGVLAIETKDNRRQDFNN